MAVDTLLTGTSAPSLGRIHLPRPIHMFQALLQPRAVYGLRSVSPRSQRATVTYLPLQLRARSPGLRGHIVHDGSLDEPVRNGRTVVTVAHDQELAHRTKRIVAVSDGAVSARSRGARAEWSYGCSAPYRSLRAWTRTPTWNGMPTG
jgi:hypothetical protein